MKKKIKLSELKDLILEAIDEELDGMLKEKGATKKSAGLKECSECSEETCEGCPMMKQESLEERDEYVYFVSGDKIGTTQHYSEIAAQDRADKLQSRGIDAQVRKVPLSKYYSTRSMGQYPKLQENKKR